MNYRLSSMIYFELFFNGHNGIGSLSKHDADDAFADDENENDDVTKFGEMFKIVGSNCPKRETFTPVNTFDDPRTW